MNLRMVVEMVVYRELKEHLKQRSRHHRQPTYGRINLRNGILFFMLNPDVG